jgi:RNA polymerase sigma-70 factor (ECF subfamily)
VKAREDSLPGKQLSDEELAAEAQAGSHRCFEALVHRYTHRLFYYLRPKMSTRQDTEDLIQETFLKTYRNIGHFDPAYKFSTWLYTIATRLAISFYRKKHVSEAVLELSASVPDPQDQAVETENADNLWDMAQGLQPLQYQALWLRYGEDLPLKEIADVMKKNQVHVRVLLHRARSNLIKQLNSDTLARGIATEPATKKLSLL